MFSLRGCELTFRLVSWSWFVGSGLTVRHLRWNMLAELCLGLVLLLYMCSSLLISDPPSLSRISRLGTIRICRVTGAFSCVPGSG